MALPKIPNLCGPIDTATYGAADIDWDQFGKEATGAVKDAVLMIATKKLEDSIGKKNLEIIFTAINTVEYIKDQGVGGITDTIEETSADFQKNLLKSIETVAKQQLCKDIKVGNARISVGGILDQMTTLPAKSKQALSNGASSSTSIMNGVVGGVADSMKGITQGAKAIPASFANRQTAMSAFS